MRTRKRLVTGIYMTLWNFPTKIIKTTACKYVVAILPAGIKASEALDLVIIQPCKQLENGYPFSIALKNQPIKKEIVYGSLIAINGDHMGQIDLAGIIGPKGEKPSIYSLKAKSNFKKI